MLETIKQLIIALLGIETTGVPKEDFEREQQRAKELAQSLEQEKQYSASLLSQLDSVEEQLTELSDMKDRLAQIFALVK